MGSGEGAEERQGKGLVDQAIKEGVKLFVQTSVDRGGDDSLNNPTNIPHFIAKHNIEKHLVNQTKDSEMGWVILRPTAFFENLVPSFFGKVFATCFEIALKGKSLQLIAVKDIGFFGAQAFIKPEEFRGKGLSLAGDELTYQQFETIFKAKTGNTLPTTYSFICRFLMWMMKDFGYMFTWFREHGYRADIEALKKMNPELKDFGTWLEKDSEFKTT